MTYIEKTIELLKEHACMKECDDNLLRFYALLVLTTGVWTGPKAVHDAWSAWRTISNPQHKSLIPFEQLDKATQDLYVYAIANVRWQLNRSSK